MWPEGFVDVNPDKITLQRARELSSKERAELIAINPVALTISWKRRLRAFLDFVIKGKSKPLGEVTHYVHKSEWQGRLSEHAHFLFWTKQSIPPLKMLSNGDLDGNQENVIQIAEALGSALLHCSVSQNHASRNKESSSLDYKNESSDFSLPSKDDAPLGIEEVYRSVTENPISFTGYFDSFRARSSISILAKAVNYHICSKYCTKQGTRTCKSMFPLPKISQSRVICIIDKNLNRNYRIRLRRNHARINPYSVPILNVWRANMDMTVLCGEPFASIVYVAYYTSKVDKSWSIRDVLQKVKQVDPNSDLNVMLRRILLNMDTCRATGLPGAASNLLQYSHRFTSSKVLRLDTRSYLPEGDRYSTSEIQSNLSSLLHEFTKGNDAFLLPDVPVRRVSEPQEDIISEAYFNSPSQVFSFETNTLVSTESMNMVQYIENYVVTNKRKLRNAYQTLDLRGKIIEPRKSEDRDVVLDLKYRVSPPDRKNPRWCAGALALHIPHRPVQDMLTIQDVSYDLVGAYKLYYDEKENINGLCLPKHPQIHDFERNETNLYTFTYVGPKTDIRLNRSDSDSAKISEMFTDSRKEENSQQNICLDPKEYPTSEINAFTDHKCHGIKSWNGMVNADIVSAENPWSIEHLVSSESMVFLPINKNILKDHEEFVTRLVAGENPSERNNSFEVEEALSYASGDRSSAAEYFLSIAVSQCKSDDQRYALKLVTTILNEYYFGYEESHFVNVKSGLPPIISMIGVPGAGKSWVIGKLRTRCEIRFGKDDVPFQSADAATLSEACQSENILNKTVSDAIRRTPAGKYGKSAALAFSGAAAGVIKGHTIHHALSFPVNLNKSIMRGELPLASMSTSIRSRLLECWSSVKVLIIDEVFTLNSEFLSLIDERLRQVFNSELQFAGIPVLIVGDPRQLVPVKGKTLFMLQKYFLLDQNTLELNSLGARALNPREEKGFRIYSSSQFYAPLKISVRLADPQFASVNMKISKYDVTDNDVKYINSFVKPISVLHKSPWIESPWLLPTWKEVNRHLSTVTKILGQKRGVFRAWRPIIIAEGTPIDEARSAAKAFCSSNIYVTSTFSCPLPYIDYFKGQIVSLKQNWNPNWNLFSNAKAFVVGVICDDINYQRQPFVPIDKAVEITISNPEFLKYTLLVKTFLPFEGPSALENVSGVIAVPWVQSTRRIMNTRLIVEGPKVLPANAFSHHQSQGCTFGRTVSNINDKAHSYGMANVVTSRTPHSQNFALVGTVTSKVLQPCPEVSKLVEAEYFHLSSQTRYKIV